MIVDPRLREDDEKGCEDDKSQERGGDFPHIRILLLRSLRLSSAGQLARSAK